MGKKPFIESPFFDMTEKICSDLLKEFNNQVKWFKYLHENRSGSVIDFSAVDIKDRCVSIELKNRYIKWNQFPTTFIEMHKYAELLHKYSYYHAIPLYINFFENGRFVAIWDLTKKIDCSITELDIYDKGHKTVYQKEQRICLSNKDAIVYERQNNGYVRIQ